LERERRTDARQSFGKVRKVDIYGEICLAGEIKWVCEGVALERLHTQERVELDVKKW
jgi:hypothetical protein